MESFAVLFSFITFIVSLMVATTARLDPALKVAGCFKSIEDCCNVEEDLVFGDIILPSVRPSGRHETSTFFRMCGILSFTFIGILVDSLQSGQRAKDVK